jgi:ATP-dependent Clp protease protease subunit
MKKKSTKKKRLVACIDWNHFSVTSNLLPARYIFLHDVIEPELASNVMKQLIFVDRLNDAEKVKLPINMWINSPGGSVSDGLMLIDTIQSVTSNVNTIVNGEACSMACILAICGDQRYATKNSIFMLHDIAGGIDGGDYTNKTADRVEFWMKNREQLWNLVASKTKLSATDLDKARHGELWLTANEALAKGLIDHII